MAWSHSFSGNAQRLSSTSPARHQRALTHPRQELDDHMELLEWELAFASSGTG